MAVCCVPKCGTDSLNCDPSVSFHDFPSNPDTAAKWIKQINFAIKTNPMWIPRGKTVICSKHFLQTDFKDNTDALKPRCIPTVFGYKYIGTNAHDTEIKTKRNETNTSPLIVKVIKPHVSENNCSSEISGVSSEFKMRKEKNNNLSKSYSKFQQSSYQNNGNKNTLVITPEQSTFNNGKTEFKDAAHKNGHKRKILTEPSRLPKISRKEQCKDLIEIGPNTFLKINPEVIKVNKKLTPSGNTVLQFLMDQKLANSQAGNFLPKLIQGTSLGKNDIDGGDRVQQTLNNAASNSKENSNSVNKSDNSVVQHVLGHLVDTHVCEESCADLKLPEDEDIPMDDYINEDYPEILLENSLNTDADKVDKTNQSDGTDASFLEKAPVLLTTNLPISHCFMEKPKYVLQLKQKLRQIAAMKLKISNMTKKIEDLEDRCIVQERQLSYSFIKRLKTIRKNSAKGDPAATYILEQIRSYPTNNSKMRWSDSTLMQCAVWCRKAPYAYEYFKKAEFFKLPCLGTVKRFMKKHPEIKTLKNKKPNLEGAEDNEDVSSSDFDFDESDDDQNSANVLSDENNEPVLCETVLTVPSEVTNPETSQATNNLKQINEEENFENSSSEIQNNVQSNTSESLKSTESNVITVDSSNLELQEIMLPSGEVVQCYSSSISNGGDAGSQYFIIPNVGDQNLTADHEYSVVQADSLPVILQSLENSQLHLQQSEQLIFITNSGDQVECSEAEVSSV